MLRRAFKRLNLIFALASCRIIFFLPIPLPAQRVITTIAGTDATFNGEGKPATDIGFGTIVGLTTDSVGNLYRADQGYFVLPSMALRASLQEMVFVGSPAMCASNRSLIKRERQSRV